MARWGGHTWTHGPEGGALRSVTAAPTPTRRTRTRDRYLRTWALSQERVFTGDTQASGSNSQSLLTQTTWLSARSPVSVGRPHPHVLVFTRFCTRENTPCGGTGSGGACTERWLSRARVVPRDRAQPQEGGPGAPLAAVCGGLSPWVPSPWVLQERGFANRWLWTGTPGLPGPDPARPRGRNGTENPASRAPAPWSRRGRA